MLVLLFLKVQDVPGSPYRFLPSDLKADKFSRNSGSFQQQMVLETKLCEQKVLIVPECLVFLKIYLLIQNFKHAKMLK
jgi:hypothetical protein